MQAAEGHSGQDQPDPVQPVAGHQLPVLGLGDDREIRRLHQQCRLCLADPHAARPRHPRRLRPAQVGIRAHEEDRPAGARSHDDRRARRGVNARPSARLHARFRFARHHLSAIVAASLAASAFLQRAFLGASLGCHAGRDARWCRRSLSSRSRSWRCSSRISPSSPRRASIVVAEFLGAARLADLCACRRRRRAGRRRLLAAVDARNRYRRRSRSSGRCLPSIGAGIVRRHRLLAGRRALGRRLAQLAGRRLLRLRREDLQREGREHAGKQIVDDARHARASLQQPANRSAANHHRRGDRQRQHG